MPSRKKHTNPFLLLIAIAICLVLGVTLRQSNADFSVLSEKPSQSVASVSDRTSLILTRNPFHLPKLPHLLLQRSHLHLNAKFLMWQLPESGLPVEATGSLW